MAYFASQRAALTGTDKSTRMSIAKGLVSPTFTDSSGKILPRGVIQMDAVTGHDLTYALGSVIGDRVGSAQAYYDRSKAIRSQQRKTSVTQPMVSELHTGASGSIKTSDTFAFPIKTVGIILGVGLVGYLVLVK